MIVLATDLTVDGPTGEISGAIRVREHLMEGNAEEKIFAPGYGEFLIEAPSELVSMAVAVPQDALSGPAPTELAHISEGAREAFDARRFGRLGGGRRCAG